MDKSERTAAEAEWVWPAACISILWLSGLLLLWVWLRTWMAVPLLLVTAVVIVWRWRSKGALVGVWSGGAALAGSSLLVWIFALSFYRIY